jgi:glutamate-ammonia-ligase adenylyltransferase
MSLSTTDMSQLLDDPSAAAAWAAAAVLADGAAAHRVLLVLAERGLPLDLLAGMCNQLEQLLPQVGDPDRVLVSVERFIGSVRSPLATAALFERDPRALGILVKLFAASPFLAELVIADPESWEKIRLGEGRPEKKEVLAATLAAEIGMPTTGTASDTDRVLRALRRFRRRETLRIAYGDLVGGQRLETVVGQISNVADCIVQAAVAAAVASVERQRGVPRGPGGERATIAAIALGKLGGGELNYSSDIDLVFVYSADGRVDGPKPCTNQEFFDRVVQETVRLIGERTDLGAAYRVDQPRRDAAVLRPERPHLGAAGLGEGPLHRGRRVAGAQAARRACAVGLPPLADAGRHLGHQGAQAADRAAGGAGGGRFLRRQAWPRRHP